MALGRPRVLVSESGSTLTPSKRAFLCALQMNTCGLQADAVDLPCDCSLTENQRVIEREQQGKALLWRAQATGNPFSLLGGGSGSQLLGLSIEELFCA